VPGGVYTNPPTVWFAATAIGVYLVLTPDGDRKLRSAGIVLFALSVQEFWGHQLFEVIASPLLRAETAVVGIILQTVQSGAYWQDNMITAKSGWGIVIYPACSSFHNVSLALLGWVTISRLASDPWRGRDYAVAGMIAAVMISMNMTRLLLMAVNENLYHYWHDGTGNQIFAITASLFVLLASLFAVRRTGDGG
jgi:Transmembrane exosortase (Exosortase_EpsH)